MSSERKSLWVSIAIVFAALVVFFTVPRVREELRPKPEGALVAVQVESEPVARVGQVEIEAGRPFSLHAVVLATSRSGERVYYTRAPGLEIDGETIDPSRVRQWPGGDVIKILWFTVEGFRPFAELAAPADLEAFRWQESLRPDWGFGWSAVGSVTPHNRNLSRTPEKSVDPPFGTARFHIRVEEYFRNGDPAPMARFRSPGAEELPDHPERVTTVTALLPGTLAPASAAFGLVHFEPAVEAGFGLVGPLARLFALRLGFSRVLILDALMAAAGRRPDELRWETVEIQEGPDWGRIGAGDLLRSGERVVVLYQDRGKKGTLDYEDLSFDFYENAAVRPLGEVFKAGGVVSWTDLERRDAGGD